MTGDFLEDLAEACQKEGVPYLLIVGSRSGASARVLSHLTHWKRAGKGKSVAEDMQQLVGEVLKED